MDANTKAIAEVLRRWHEAEPKTARIYDMAEARKRREEASKATPRRSA